MGHGSWVNKMRDARATTGLCALVLICIAIFWSSLARAETRRGGPIEGDPKRSYGAIDVIMYQTNW
jgi:hypothetical protein